MSGSERTPSIDLKGDSKVGRLSWSRPLCVTPTNLLPAFFLAKSIWEHAWCKIAEGVPKGRPGLVPAGSISGIDYAQIYPGNKVAAGSAPP